MTDPPSSLAERRQLIWRRVHHELIKHAKPDSRFHYDFLSFTPNFTDSTSAIDRLVELPCYKSANTLLVTSDNSLEEVRYRALKDGKKVLVGTYRLRRGFLLLNPERIADEEYRTASWLDGMERHGIGRHLTLAQFRDESVKVDLCVLGGLAFNVEGVTIWEGQALFEVQWAMLHDIEVLGHKTPVAAIAHSCQVVNEEDYGLKKITPEKSAEVQCDFVITPDKVFEIDGAVKPSSGVEFDLLDPKALDHIPPLQELKGVRMMQDIMKEGGFGQEDKKSEKNGSTADEQLGISMVDRIMKGYKA